MTKKKQNLKKKAQNKSSGGVSAPTPPVTVDPSSPPEVYTEPTGPELAKLVAARIDKLEDSKKQTDAQKFVEKGYIKAQIKRSRKAVADFSSGLGDPDVKQKLTQTINPLFRFLEHLGSVFMDEASRHQKNQEDLKTSQVSLSTFQKLCRSLQNEKNAMKKKFTELEEAEKKWRADLEHQFDQSIQDIKIQISNHEHTNKSILDDNEKLRVKMISVLEQDQLYIQENEILKQTLLKKEKQAMAESGKYQLMLTNVKQERSNLSEHLKTSLDMNKGFNVKLEEYRAKYLSLQDAMTQSTDFINQLKSMNDKLQKGIKTLHKSNDEFLRKAKTYQATNIKLEAESSKLKKQNITLMNLSRKLRGDIRELRAEVALLKENQNE